MKRSLFFAGLALLVFGPSIEPALMGQTVIRFSNLETGFGINAPYYDEAGTNRLGGAGYVAGLWIGYPGSTPDTFFKVGPSQPFRTGVGAGYWVPVDIPIPIFGQFLAQVRFWDITYGASYDAVVAVQGRLGVSRVLVINPGFLGLQIPPPSVGLTGLQSASLTPITSVTRGLGTQVDSMRTASGLQTNRMCEITVGTNRWFRFTNAIAGEMIFDTKGSSIDTVLGLFSSSIATPQLLVCNDNYAPGQTASQVRFPGQVNTLYQVNVAGKNGAFGEIRLNYHIGTPLSMRTVPGNQVQVSWPADASGFVLESTTNVTSPNSWAPGAVSPRIETGRAIVEVGATNRARAFRLRKP